MDKIKINQITKKIKNFRSLQFFIILIVVVFLILTGLRFDHIHLEKLKRELKVADQSGDSKKISRAIYEIRQFSSTHTVISMSEENGRTFFHFGTGPIYLEHQYLKTANQELEKIKNRQAETGISNGRNQKERNIYAEASSVCQPQAIKNGWSWNSKPYIDCMMGELAKHPSAPEVADLLRATVPSSNLYRISYASPIWAPSFVGFMSILAIILIIIILIRIITAFVLSLVLIYMRLKKRRN